ncbi:MAG: GTPase HflX [Desulfatiglandaceae bacterium]
MEKLYRRKVPPDDIVSHELARRLAWLSKELNRQLAVLLTRKGKVACVIAGDKKHIHIPDTTGFRAGGGRLKGLRCIHTHLSGEDLSEEDLTDMALLALDLIACIKVDQAGLPGEICFAHILPQAKDGENWAVTRVPDTGRLNINFLDFIQGLEDELRRGAPGRSTLKAEKAILVAVCAGPRWREKARLDELRNLAVSDELEVVDSVIQTVKKIDSHFLIGKGKLSELALKCVQKGADLLVFDNDLTPAQVKSLTDFTELKIIDRTQLILDIFARRAVSREGKIQVELAQLQYLLPRLAMKNTAMSRLTGGIGGRGPGETKLEINRRRVHQRIARLSRELADIARQRQERRRLRTAKNLPVISIVGYTNAGKSTLLNSLTNSRVAVKNRLFETLDPSSRRLRFPREREAIITDTVGFIRDLPPNLVDAFASTLEELQEADLLLHVVDATSTSIEEQKETVESLLEQLDIHLLPRLLVVNKTDLLGEEEGTELAKALGGIAASAVDPSTLTPLVEEMKKLIWPHSASPAS